MNKRITYLLLSSLLILSLLLLFNHSSVQADQTTHLYPVKDAFVRENYPAYNYGSWNDLTIGRSFNLGNYFTRSWAYIDFDLSDLDQNSIIKKAELEMYQYARSDYAEGNYNVNVARAKGNWSEMNITWNNKPSIAGIYDRKSVSGSASQWFNPPQKNTFDVTNLVKEWVNEGVAEYGMVLYKDGGNVGGFWCSKNYNNSTCFKNTRPRLKITYTTNHSPNIPTPYSPKNLAKFGGDSSSQGALITLKVKGLGDDENNLKETYFYYKLKGSSDWIRTDKRTGKKTAQYTQNFSDGDWIWRARSIDSMGVWSDYSPIMEFRVDTTSPQNNGLVTINPYQNGVVNTIEAKKSVDALSDMVYYKFQLSSGDECGNLIQESDWQESRLYTFKNLKDEVKYCYEVKVKDNLGNTSDYCEGVSALQDSTNPVVENYNIDKQIFSPNEDLKYDQIHIDIKVFDKYFDNWKLTIFAKERKVVKSYSTEILEDTLIWEGKNFDNELLDDGEYVLNLTVVDKAGNKVEIEREVIIDNTPPALNISFPENNSYFNQDFVEVSGITEAGAFVKVNAQTAELDENGIFETKTNLNHGENVIEIVSQDAVANFTKKNILIKKETEKPIIQLVAPKDLIKNKQPKISFNFIDQSSGINPDTFNLSIVDPSGSNLILVNEGINVQKDFGYIDMNCNQISSNASKTCQFDYNLNRQLSKDGEYRIDANIKDYAQNESEKLQSGFFLDSETFIEVLKPENNVLLNHSKTDFTILAEINSQIVIDHTRFHYDFFVENNAKEVTKCYGPEEELVSLESVSQICEIRLKDLKLEFEKDQDIGIKNPIQISLLDRAGNKKEITHMIVVNLYAVDLSISSELDFISPNGDSRQDGTNFKMHVKNSNNETDTYINSWSIDIERNLEKVFRYNFEGPLPSDYYFNGKDKNEDWLANGDYKYYLEVETTDGMLLQTPKQDLFVRKDLEQNVVITTPKDGSITTRGVVNLQGQAPLESNVKICVNYLSLDGDCNDTQIAQVDKDGFYTAIVPLSSRENIIWAEAFDKFGNKSKKSNEVKVTLDFTDPLVNVVALPSFSCSR